MNEIDIVQKLTHLFYVLRKENLWKSDEDHNMGHRDIMILYAIMKINDGDLVKMSDVSTHFHITPAAVSQVIKKFEKKKWIERVLLDNDRRSVYIKVSDDAKDRMHHCETNMKEKLLKFIDSLGEEDTKALIRILEKSILFSKEYKEEEEGKHT